eukprot:GGOE01006664.1.p1 GENE.GGOE01006664.1~~GGOE01006664.1.p1  ORF type:complete len:131 (-),score=13.79 GGOE01006664.1:935-1297(-)
MATSSTLLLSPSTVLASRPLSPTPLSAPKCSAPPVAIERCCWRAPAKKVAGPQVCANPGTDPPLPSAQRLTDISDALAAAIRTLELAERDARWECYAHECSEWESLFEDIMDKLDYLGVS